MMTPLLYEDAGLIAVDKPAGIATIPERFEPHCLLAQVQEERSERLFVVHRLDKETSGVLLFARDANTHRALNTLFETRQVEKRYAAVVEGHVSGDRGEVNAPLRTFGSGRMGVDVARGKPSRTAWSVRERGSRHTLLDVTPQTGRRHQIRVHLYHIGHPVAGDPLYGARTPQPGYDRMFLHALSIQFRLPTRKELFITAPLPESFPALVRDSRAG